VSSGLAPTRPCVDLSHWSFLPGPRGDDLTNYGAFGPFVRSFILLVDPGDICPPQTPERHPPLDSPLAAITSLHMAVQQWKSGGRGQVLYSDRCARSPGVSWPRRARKSRVVGELPRDPMGAARFCGDFRFLGTRRGGDGSDSRAPRASVSTVNPATARRSDEVPSNKAHYQGEKRKRYAEMGKLDNGSRQSVKWR
jgi:hypothetical protein